MTSATNWAGTYTYQATHLHRPSTLDEVRAVVARAPKIHALGARHAFTGIADAAELISLERLAPEIVIDRDAHTVTVGAGVRYGGLAQALERAGWALHNLASLPHISVAGAIATATHGSGDTNGNLATAVVGLEFVTSDGDLLAVSRADADFAGMAVSLGALGVVTRLTLAVQPSYLVQQEVFEHLAWEMLVARFDEVMGSADSVSLFTDFGDDVDQVWRKSRVDPEHPPARQEQFFGARAATHPLHPVRTLSAETCTVQLGRPGPWVERLPHFRPEATPASGDEIQSEYMLPRRHAVAALAAMRELAPVLRPHLWIAEIRTVAADDLWLSTAYRTDTVCLHVSWKRDVATVDRLLPIVEAALAPFEPRPHWGKVFAMTARDLEGRYARLPAFRRLAARLDQRGAFRNAFLDRHVFG